MRELPTEPIWIDANGCLTERRWLGGQEVIVHHDDLPESDVTVLDGIRVTTALRTVIDIAPDVEADHLPRILEDLLARREFTVEDADHRTRQPDLRDRLGARLVRWTLGLPPD